ncbi:MULTISPECIES: glucose-6-phosphate dehydrogenase assembly protein OpcA [Corynebacterium]|uniref:glucose-6-phosphate dehydrogenase assembly protein OpcA n=1 Tax=Corynebacterium TaxID=1716 RepID=UPI0008A1F8E3|nr:MULTISPECIES: glucose-6-phosphate dehydrogenase assembly protein OpcA [Corynebacterium]MBU5655200.1 glucose-6-phosphate dehydrogenase assembly protein OpcA [Corynebacterium aurimucosum]OFL23213.1 oxppcycle protein OpcA [Corynebacterium sp. HMSC062A03]OFQ34604.1 oxppcycle protein OpcA [Corynebacterium sp. HMSC072D12]
MIIPLPDTTTRKISKKLVEMQEHYTLTTGRVLTLIVMTEEGDDLDNLLTSVRDASHEHPSRVIVIATGSLEEETRLDAELRVGGEAGASEIVVMHLHGALADQAEAVVTPLLLPDTPIVAWWPTACPPAPAAVPIGALAQRRITNVAFGSGVDQYDLHVLSSGYKPGDSDMSWGAITLWRGIIASALDRHPHEPVNSVEISGAEHHAAVDFAAGWLLDALSVPVTRRISECEAGAFPITSLVFRRPTADITVMAVDATTVKVSVPGSPESLVSLAVRSEAEVLSEELRHLDSDRTYAHALRALARVHYSV